MAHPKYTDHWVKLESYELGNKFFQKLADNLLRISTLSEEANEFLRLPNTTDKLLLKKYLHGIALLYTVYYFYFQQNVSNIIFIFVCCCVFSMMQSIDK